MSDPFRTLVDHFHSSHVALLHLFRQCHDLIRQGRSRRDLLPGMRDAAQALRAHHRYEDEVLIPEVRGEEHELWDGVIEDHQSLDEALRTLESATPAGPPDLRDLDQAVLTILEILPDHFEKEEAELTEAAWREHFANDTERARAFGRRTAEHNREGLKPATRMLALILYNLPPDERDRFTERMPGFLVHGLVPYAFRLSWRSRRAFMAYPPPRLTPRPLRRSR